MCDCHCVNPFKIYHHPLSSYCHTMFAGTKQINSDANGTTELQSHRTPKRKGDQVPRRVSVRTLLTAFVMCAAIWLGWIHCNLATSGWLNPSLLILAVVFTVGGLARELPLQNAIMASVVVAFMSALVWIIAAKIGIRLGPVLHKDRFSSPTIGILPWPVPLLGVVMLLNSRHVARLIFRGWPDLSNRGLWTIGLASLLALAMEMGLERYASGAERFWISGTVPWLTLAARLVVTVLILVANVPWLIDKRGISDRVVNLFPLWLWLAVALFLSAANAACGWREWAASGLMLALAVGILSLRGARGH
jgi:hypothetical protein